MGSKKYRLWRNWLVRSVAGLFVVCLLAGGVACFFPEEVLTMDNGLVQADVIVVLGGQPKERAQRAAELFQDGVAPKIVISGIGDDAQEQHILETNGVPSADIVREGRSQTTRENAQFSIPLLRAMGAKRVIIVTSWYHSRRGLNCFEHYAPDIQFYSRPSYYGFQRANENRKYIKGYIRSEYVKLAGYWICYGVCPF